MQSSIITKQNTSKLLPYKQYFKTILKLILKSFDFQCDFDFQITTSKMIWILNPLYLGDWILILKSSTYDDFAHLCMLPHSAQKSLSERMHGCHCCVLPLPALHSAILSTTAFVCLRVVLLLIINKARLSIFQNCISTMSRIHGYENIMHLMNTNANELTISNI